MRASGIKVNSPECSFGLDYIHFLCYIITWEGIKSGTKKVQGIMDLGRPTTTTEVRDLVGMVQYYRDMWPRWSHLLAPLVEAVRVPKGRTIFCNDDLEAALHELKILVSAETPPNYPDWNILITVHTYACYEQLGAVISKK